MESVYEESALRSSSSHVEIPGEAAPRALVNFRLLMSARDCSVTEMEDALRQGAYVETRRPIIVMARDASEDAPNPSKPSVQRGIGMTPLMYAAQSGFSEGCSMLLSHGALVNSEDEDGMRALHFAACSGHLETCRVLVEAGAEVEGLDDDGHSALGHVSSEVLGSGAARQWKALLEPSGLNGMVAPTSEDNQN